MTNKLGFYCDVPLYSFQQNGINSEATRLLLVMFKDYILYGAKGYKDENGVQMKHKFDEVKKEDTFLVPIGIFMFFDKEEMNIEHLQTFVYLCYLAHVQKTHIVKVNKNLVK